MNIFNLKFYKYVSCFIACECDTFIILSCFSIEILLFRFSFGSWLQLEHMLHSGFLMFYKFHYFLLTYYNTNLRQTCCRLLLATFHLFQCVFNNFFLLLLFNVFHIVWLTKVSYSIEPNGRKKGKFCSFLSYSCWASQLKYMATDHHFGAHESDGEKLIQNAFHVHPDRIAEELLVVLERNCYTV